MRGRSLGVAASLVGVLGLAGAFATYARAPGATARNAILISLDTLRADYLGLYGHERDTSPQLDRFARSSFVFERALASSPNTAPSHASIMTSLYPGRHGFTGNGDRLSQAFPTLAVELRRAGFRTGAFVDGGYLRARFGFDRGFEVYDDAAGGIARLWRRARRWLEAADGRPFFLFLHCYDIHAPYLPPPPFRGMFHTRPYRGDFVPTAANMQAVFLKERELDAEDLEHIRASYEEGIRYTDAQLGRILDQLAKSGLLEETLVVITSDHGEEFGEHGSVLHWQLYHGPNLRVPLLIRVPGHRRTGVTIAEPVQLIDLAPTILELLGAAPLAGAQGRSLARALRHGTSAWQHAVHSALARWAGAVPAYAWWSDPHELPLRSVVSGPYQLIFDEERPGQEQLFDVIVDPLARSDLAARRPERVAELRAAALEVMRENRSAPPGTPEALDAGTREALRALGYGSD